MQDYLIFLEYQVVDLINTMNEIKVNSITQVALMHDPVMITEDRNILKI